MPDLAPRQLILTLYGLYARDEHNWLSVASVVQLLSDLDAEPAGVRSSISRLKRRGVLESLKVDGTAGYRLSDSALEVLREGDTRIFSTSARPCRTASCSSSSRSRRPSATAGTSCAAP